MIVNSHFCSIAYIHALLSFRLPSLSSTHLASQDLETLDIRTCLGELVPFLVDPKSTVRYESIGSAWGNVWESIGSEMVSCVLLLPVEFDLTLNKVYATEHADTTTTPLYHISSSPSANHHSIIS